MAPCMLSLELPLDKLMVALIGNTLRGKGLWGKIWQINYQLLKICQTFPLSKFCAIAMVFDNIFLDSLIVYLRLYTCKPYFFQKKLKSVNILYHVYRTVGNFRGVLIFVDFVGPTQTTKNSLKNCTDPRKYNFLGLKTTNLSLFHHRLFKGASRPLIIYMVPHHAYGYAM